MVEHLQAQNWITRLHFLVWLIDFICTCMSCVIVTCKIIIIKHFQPKMVYKTQFHENKNLISYGVHYLVMKHRTTCIVFPFQESRLEHPQHCKWALCHFPRYSACEGTRPPCQAWGQEDSSQYTDETQALPLSTKVKGSLQAVPCFCAGEFQYHVPYIWPWIGLWVFRMGKAKCCGWAISQNNKIPLLFRNSKIASFQNSSFKKKGDGW